MGVQVGQILRQAALRTPASIGVVDLGAPGSPRREYSYAQLELCARTVAARLIELGVKPGECVALLAENSAELVSAWFGIVYAGAVVVPLHVLSAPSEIAQRLEHAKVSLLVHDEARAGLAAQALLQGTNASARAGASASRARGLTLGALCDAAGSALSHPRDVSADSTAMVLYTSGTTGKAKGAAISHASLVVHTAALVHHALFLQAEDRVLCALPLTHSFGCRMAMLAPFFAGACMVIVPRFEAERTHELLCEEQITWMPVVPTMLAAWVRLGTLPKPSRLRWVLSAGAPLPDELARRAEASLGVEVRQGYGMTEATFATIDAPPDARTLGSVGRPVWGVELRVVDAQGRDLPAAESGELLVRGHNVMSHYLWDPESTLEAAQDGFLRSGDVGRIDAQGRLFIVDRIKDLVIRGGYNVYPAEVEEVLAAHPSVAQVAVIGRPDAFYGEEVVAVIVPAAGIRADADALAAWADELLSRTKRVREYAFVEALPLGASGKVQKRMLREQLAAGTLSLVRVGQDVASVSEQATEPETEHRSIR